MDYFLKQSSKKVIFLTLIIPAIVQLILVNVAQSMTSVGSYYLTFVFFWLLLLPYFYWLNKAVGFLYSHSNNHFKLRLGNFKASLIINIIASLNFILFVAYIFSFVFKVGNVGEPDTGIMLFMVLVQFIGIVSFFYSVYFSCKIIATIDLQRKIHLNDIAGNLLAFSFVPLAVWVIHNKVKEIQHKTK